MALKPCQGCGKQVDTTAKMCPGCGRPHPTASGFAKFLVGSFVLTLAVGGSIKVCSAVDEVATARPGNAVPSLTEAVSASIERQVVDDSIKQYEIAKRGGAKVDICVHAGMVAAAFMQAKDEAGYKKWKAIEKSDCRRFGMPE